MLVNILYSISEEYIFIILKQYHILDYIIKFKPQRFFKIIQKSDIYPGGQVICLPLSR